MQEVRIDHQPASAFAVADPAAWVAVGDTVYARPMITVANDTPCIAWYTAPVSAPGIYCTCS